MLKLHFLLVDTLFKGRQVMNKVINGQKKSRKHLTKNAFFDIQCLADQLYCS